MSSRALYRGFNGRRKTPTKRKREKGGRKRAKKEERNCVLQIQ